MLSQLLKTLVGCLVLLVVGSGLSTTAHADVMIDNFNDPASVFASTIVPAGTPIGVNNLGIPVSDTIGGSRVGSIFFSGSTTAADQFSVSYGSTYNGALTINTSANASSGGVGLLLTYDANGAGLNANLSSEAGISLSFQILDASAVNTTLTVTLTDNGNDSATSTIIITTVGNQTVFLPFSNFTGIGIVDLANIKSIGLSGSIPANGDLQISNIAAVSAVPEPTSMLAWGVIVGAGWLVRRRKRVA